MIVPMIVWMIVQVCEAVQQAKPEQWPTDVVKAASSPAWIICMSLLERFETDCLFSFNFRLVCFGFIIVNLKLFECPHLM
jgi:hypothetical protein